VFELVYFSKEFYHLLMVGHNEAQRVYELWRVLARTSPNIN